MAKFSLYAALLAVWMCSPSLLARQATPTCRAAGPVVQLPQLSEASGIATGRRTPDRLWTHNDSGQPVLVALDRRGNVTGRIRLTGMTVQDWEATAVGPCPAGSCLYIGDIGDNRGARERITVFRLPEPDAASAEATVEEAFHGTYPDGPHDAEALLVTPKGDILIVTKGNAKTVGLYRFPRDMRPGTTVALTRVGKPAASKAASLPERVTDGAVSPDGAWIALRTNTAMHLYAASGLLSGEWHERGRVSLSNLGEPQGEGVTFADNTTLYLAGEGGGRSRPGTFARLTCSY